MSVNSVNFVNYAYYRILQKGLSCAYMNDSLYISLWLIWRDMARLIWRDIARLGKIWRDMMKYGKIWRDLQE